jgi:hypothetical protein
MKSYQRLGLGKKLKELRLRHISREKAEMFSKASILHPKSGEGRTLTHNLQPNFLGITPKCGHSKSRLYTSFPA